MGLPLMTVKDLCENICVYTKWYDDLSRQALTGSELTARLMSLTWTSSGLHFPKSFTSTVGASTGTLSPQSSPDMAKVWEKKGIPYSRKLSRIKTFANFAVLWLFVKVFSTKLLGVVSFGTEKASNPRKFSLKSFLLYGSLTPRLNLQNVSGQLPISLYSNILEYWCIAFYHIMFHTACQQSANMDND